MKYKQTVCSIVCCLLFGIAASHLNAQANPIIKQADSLFQAGDWSGAKSLYLAAEKAGPLAPSSRSRLGFSRHRLGMYDEAMKDYQQLIVMNNVPPVIRGITYSRIARIYTIRADKPQALAMLDSAIANGYANLGEMDSLPDFNNMRSDTAFVSRRNRVYVVAMPCMVNAHAREFDFWIGEWNVYVTGTNTYAGHSLIQMISQGCAILENWDSPGGTGKSINYIDPANNKWKQAWAGSGANGVQEFVDGEYIDGAMRFRFSFVNPQGQTLQGRFIFYNEKPGQVRQFNETSADGGKTWVTSYDFTYIRKK